MSLQELRADANLTPERLLRSFADFKFKLGEEVQSFESFLASKAGDCDDFATLAATLLREKGYTPKLVAVFMERQVHVICFVAETKTYLDFNNRKLACASVSSDGTLSDIARKVAQSFHASWTCASEFVYKGSHRHTLATDFPQLSLAAERPRSVRR